MSKSHRSALAKFRCGVALIRLETERYEDIPENLRLCLICKLSFEHEIHLLFKCVAYHDLRQMLISKSMEIDNNFVNLNNQEKLIHVFVLSNKDIVRETAKTRCAILKERNNLLYK